ncbi:MAG: 4a-hydroxytetrahydrobiopterin dehydratase [Candidatus Krumholzibacteriia bacterium]|nr:4a-hydroxytetrahydrobiopterin dehydratase [bacterium]MCB9516789.1 4a-hydroxytetrahydrobiopterin dehydratase [Candidatus Latescibacterota bacterium]
MSTSTPLAERHCRDLPAGTPALADGELRSLLEQVPGWTVDGERLRRDYRFPDFVTALAFVNRVGALAEAEGHHPDLELAWGRVGVALWTHSVGGLSENDFILAARMNALPATG